MLENAQSKFIKSREVEFNEKGKVETDEETFHRILTLAKYFNICNGRVVSEQTILDEVINMEEERIRRVQAKKVAKESNKK